MPQQDTEHYNRSLAYGVRDPLTDPTYVAVEIDPVAPWLVTIDGAHHQTHEGEHFAALSGDATLADAETHIVHLKVPAATYPHVVYHVTCPSAFTIAFYENPTVSNDGTVVTAYNRNRSSAKTPGMLVYHTPTTSALGTLLAQFYVGGGAQRAGGSERSEAEWILKPSEDYLIVVTSRANGNSATVMVDWYEEGAD